MTLDDFQYLPPRYIDFLCSDNKIRCFCPSRARRVHAISIRPWSIEDRFPGRGFGAFNTQPVLDVTNGLFRLKDDESTIVFEKSALKSFRITEDKEPLFTGTAAGLVCAESKNPERVRLLAPRIEQF